MHSMDVAVVANDFSAQLYNLTKREQHVESLLFLADHIDDIDCLSKIYSHLNSF